MCKNEELIIQESNIILRASTTFDSIWHARILALLAKEVTENYDPNTRGEYILDINNILDTFSEDERPINSGQLSLNIQQACEKMLKHIIKLKPNGYDWVICSLISKVSKIEGQSKLHFTIEPELLPYFLDFKKGYTYESLIDLFSLSKIYSQKLFRLLLSYQFHQEKYKEFDYIDLANYLNIPDTSMRKASNFEKKILIPVLEEINSKVKKLNLDYKIIKKGQKIKAVRFIYLNEQKINYLPNYEIAEQLQSTNELYLINKSKDKIFYTYFDGYDNELMLSIKKTYESILPKFTSISIITNSLFKELYLFYNEYPMSKKINFWEEYFNKISTNTYICSDKFHSKNFIFFFNINNYEKIINNGLSKNNIDVLAEQKMAHKINFIKKLDAFVEANKDKILVLKTTSRKFKVYKKVNKHSNTIDYFIREIKPPDADDFWRGDEDYLNNAIEHIEKGKFDILSE